MLSEQQGPHKRVSETGNILTELCDVSFDTLKPSRVRQRLIINQIKYTHETHTWKCLQYIVG